MSNRQHPALDTATIHAGQVPDSDTLSRAVPLYRTTAYQFRDSAHAARLFALEEEGNIYTRLGNPTVAVLEERVTALEGGAASVAFASGTAAIFNTIITIAKAGDHIVAASNLYGGTYTMLDAILPDLGVTTTFVGIGDHGAWERAITPATRLLYAETIGNPGLDVADLDALSRIARSHNLPLVVDATFTTPALLRSIGRGADIVVNSLSKWMGGHGTAIGGIVTDAGTFDWRNPKFELFNRPDPAYHGLRWAHDLPEGKARAAFALRLRTGALRNLGACLSPDNAWHFLQGLETLHLRMPRHSESALAVARHLKDHPKAAWVRHPALEGDPSHEVAQRVLGPGAGSGGMVVFGVKSGRGDGGRETGARFIDALRLFSHLANVGDAKSLAIHPASTTHSQLGEEQQRASGLSPDLVRLSIGLERLDDILADLDQALERA